MQIIDVLRQSPLPSLETELLLSFLLKKEREFVLAHIDYKITKEIFRRYKNLEKKRLANWSIAVLIGYREFYSLKFLVNKQVLVPRPETELLVDEALKITLEDAKKEKLSIIDIGTGSGAIIISLAATLPSLKNISLLASDISSSALKIAKKNAKFHKQEKNIIFFQGNLLNPLLKKIDKFSNLIITANLPYLTPTQVKKSSSISKEPRLALVAGNDGLKYYRLLFKQINSLLKDKKKKISILCEIDPSQDKNFALLVKKLLPTSSLVFKEDLTNRPRLAIISIFKQK